MREFKFHIEKDVQERLDLYLSNRLKEISRTKIQDLIKDGLVLVNGKKKKPKYIIVKNDNIYMSIPEPESIEVLPENIKIDIVYEDSDIVIINKQQDMVVHPASGNYSGTLVNALLFHVKDLSTIGGDIRRGIVHRLDKDTSGILIVAKNDYAHEFLVNQFKNRDVKRKYITLVYGNVKNNYGIINAPIGRDWKNRKRMSVNYTNGKEAITQYKVLQYFEKYTLLEVELKTGRTHQIRVHLSYIGHPILGDKIYSRRKNIFNLNKQLLHAKKIGFIHPSTGKYMEFETDMPKRFNEIISKVK